MDMSDRLLVILDVGIMVSIKSIIFSMKFTIVVLFWTEFGPFLTQDFEQSCLANADPVRFKSQRRSVLTISGPAVWLILEYVFGAAVLPQRNQDGNMPRVGDGRTLIPSTSGLTSLV